MEKIRKSAGASPCGKHFNPHPLSITQLVLVTLEGLDGRLTRDLVDALYYLQTLITHQPHTSLKTHSVSTSLSAKTESISALTCELQPAISSCQNALLGHSTNWVRKLNKLYEEGTVLSSRSTKVDHKSESGSQPSPNSCVTTTANCRVLRSVCPAHTASGNNKLQHGQFLLN